MADNHNLDSKTPKKIYALEPIILKIERFSESGTILDIGGGGEGVIGDLMQDRVIAIDHNRRELEEAASGPVKLVTDAANMSFLHDTFPLCTAFFSLMYMKEGLIPKVMAEVFRVLSPDAVFKVWDAHIPLCRDDSTDIVAFKLEAILPHKTVKTAYGVPWPESERSSGFYLDMARRAGFRSAGSLEGPGYFYLELVKP